MDGLRPVVKIAERGTKAADAAGARKLEACVPPLVTVSDSSRKKTLLYRSNGGSGTTKFGIGAVVKRTNRTKSKRIKFRPLLKPPQLGRPRS